jgi:predicted MPP superfamily phosphohydrolase
MRWFFFSFPVFLFYGGNCFYIGKRILDFIRYFYPNTRLLIYWPVFALLCIILVFVNFFSHNLLFLRKAGSIWMAVFLYMFMLLVISDFTRIVLYLAGKRIANINFYTVGISLLLCVIIVVSGMLHARSIKTASYDLALKGSGNDLKIALISDLHIGQTVGEKWVGNIVEKANSVQPDIVFIAGDIFDGNLDIVKNMQGVISKLKTFNAPLGVYAVLGNHDVDRQGFRNGSANRIVQILKEAGIMLLQDEVREIQPGLFLAGRKDARPIGMNAKKKTAFDLLSGIEGTIIVLDHQPVQFEQIQNAGADLVLSGHTHNGQIFPGNLMTYIIYKKAGSVSYGYWRGETMQGVVTSGAGLWGPPLRVGTNSEITVINLKFMQ